MGMLAQLVLVIGRSTELSIVVKATVILLLAILVIQIGHRVRAAVRHALLAATFAVLLTFPIVSALMPPVALNIPVADAAFAIAPAAVDSGIRLSDPGLVASTAPVLRTGRGRSIAVTTLLRLAWFAGAIAFCAPLVSGLWRLRRIRRQGLPWPQGDGLVQSIARDAGIGRAVILLLHEEIAAPMTCGFLQPAVVLPVDAPQWDERDLRQAVIHELEHVRRADWLTHVGARVVCALYWFHPLVWTAWRRLGLDAERACDDAVLRGAERTAYAEQLLQLACRLSHRSAPPLLAMADRSDLRARIAAVLDGSQSRGRAGTLQAAVILGGAVVLVLGISPLHAVASRTSSIDLTPRLRFAPRLRAQAAQAPVAAGNTPMFEAASIKRNKSGDGRMQLGGPPGRFTATNVPVRNLIQNAYRLQPFQLVGAPGWIGTDRFDIVAKADGTLDPPPFAADQQTGPSRLQLMLRALLAERFKLMAHTETRELPVYALTLARSDGRLGGQLRRSTTDCATLALTRRGGPGGAPGPGGTGALAKGGPDGRGIGLGPGPMPAQGERPPCGVRVGPGSIMAGGVSASQLARELSSWLNQIVVDRTGLTGTFDVDLTWTPDQFSQGRGELPSGSVAIDPSGPSIYTAVQEQLGLKLESQQGSVDVLVIDHVEQPTED